MIKISEERAHYQKELNYIRHQMIEAIEQKDHYQKRIKVLEEENIILQNENQKLQLEKNELTGQLKVIKKIRVIKTNY
jgi:hypothetical protein